MISGRDKMVKMSMIVPFSTIVIKSLVHCFSVTSFKVVNKIDFMLGKCWDSENEIG